MIVSARWTGPAPEALDAAVGSEAFLDSAGRAAHRLPRPVDRALGRFLVAPPAEGALLLGGMPTGRVPATPSHPTDPVAKDHVSELVLLAVARRLGEPVGYLPEHGGDVVQNLVPTPEGAARQVSTSSAVDLAFHTETAFHPHAPRYLVLLCLRGDPAARTTLCSVADVLPHLDPVTRAVLAQPRFTCGVDESFTHGATAAPTDPRAILGGDAHRPTFWFDADLMRGTDPAAQAALDQLRSAVAQHHGSVVLRAGDCLVVDNTMAVHGRSAYPARFDGTDRWVQRAFVVADLAASAADRRGRVITTTFA